jgi:hypothetical protein
MKPTLRHFAEALGYQGRLSAAHDDAGSKAASTN